MSGKHWTADETAAWRKFFAGDGPRPDGRRMDVAVRRLKPKPLADLDEPEIAHATSAAAMRHISRIPHRHDGDLIRFVECVQAIALQPWFAADYKHPWPGEVFDTAVREAREAVCG